jgi:hypothetical protein
VQLVQPQTVGVSSAEHSSVRETPTRGVCPSRLLRAFLPNPNPNERDERLKSEAELCPSKPPWAYAGKGCGHLTADARPSKAAARNSGKVTTHATRWNAPQCVGVERGAWGAFVAAARTGMSLASAVTAVFPIFKAAVGAASSWFPFAARGLLIDRPVRLTAPPREAGEAAGSTRWPLRKAARRGGLDRPRQL